jgi:hypothetical protein
MKILKLCDIMRKLQALQKGEDTFKSAAKWAIQQHWLYENGSLDLEEGYEQIILDLLIELIHSEDKDFRLTQYEIRDRIESLERICRGIEER